MSGFLFDNPEAFAPFYDEKIAITSHRGEKAVRTTCRASVMQVEKDDPFNGSASVESDRLRYSVALPLHGEGGWNRKDPPQVGDEITTESGLKLAVAAIKVGQPGVFEIEAREV